jgi:alkylhydroperoxidase/carboxymuconolactone decarboxylase family protein YurZ
MASGKSRIDLEPVMSPDQVGLLRRLALNDRDAVESVMGGSRSHSSLGPATEALVKIVTLLSVDSDPATFQWAVDIGLASGLEDEDIFHALIVVAPLIGVARLTSSLPHLMEALSLELVEG